MGEKENENGTDLSKTISLISIDYDEVILKAYFMNNEIEDGNEKNFSKLKKEILSKGENTHFFLSRLHELAFYFSDSAKKEHSNYDEELHITPLHIIKIEKARELRKIYLSIFNSTVRADIAKTVGIDFKRVEQDISKTFQFVTRGKLK